MRQVVGGSSEGGEERDRLSLDKGDVEERTVRVEELEGEQLEDERVLVSRVGAVVLPQSQLRGERRVDSVENLCHLRLTSRDLSLARFR